ncbi:MAG TPA: hypothetical protein VMI47_05310 [Pseudolabrys sp.]|nr:hypothetical protein [Pseudolabrys sp.]
MAATILGILPVSAQVVIRERDGDAAVVVHRHHHWWHDRAECRTVHVRTVLPDGRVIVRTRHTCD